MRCNTLVMSMLVAVTTAAIGSDQPASVEVTPNEKAWVMLLGLTLAHMHDAEHLQEHGFSERAREPLIAHANAAQKRIEDVGRAAYADFCKKRDMYSADREAFAQAIERLDRDTKAIQQEAVAALPKVLNATDYTAFTQFLDHSPPVTVIRIDPGAEVRRPEYSIEQFMERFCEGTSVRPEVQG